MTRPQITLGRFRASDLVVETKPDLTPVSEADRAVEAAIRDLLAERAPDHAVFGEEYGGAELEAEHRWIVDPIDGTKNYVRGVPVWATLLALEHRGRIVAGVVSAPALGVRWWASRGGGAYRDGEPIQVSNVATLDDAHLCFAWDTQVAFKDQLHTLSQRCWRTRGFGDFWQHMLVADGSADVAVDPVVAYWDIAALIPIIEEAGGQWSALEGLGDPRGATSFVSSNGRLHAAALDVLEDDAT